MNEITSRKNPLVQHFRRLGADGAYRRETGEFLCDGEKLLKDALLSGAEVTTVLTEREELPFSVPGAKVYRVTRAVMEAASPLKTPQDILFACKMPLRDASRPAGFSILLDGIQDPGNMGTILRTAAAFGVGQVLLTGACADPFGPKTVRATMGAVFRMPVRRVTLAELAEMKSEGLTLYGAALREGSEDIRSVPIESGVVAIGSEGRGLSGDVLALCDKTVIIPMAPGTESLNAATAAAIVIWEAAKRRKLV
ncbi:MAG: RNA methyltransferase [Clostridiales bacterium]|nr:RNA methyltransferase [Clostridiales bacterium]